MTCARAAMMLGALALATVMRVHAQSDPSFLLDANFSDLPSYFPGLLGNGYLYGFTGLRLREAGLVQVYPPVLPASWRSLTLRDVHVRSGEFDITVTRDANGAVRLTRREHH